MAKRILNKKQLVAVVYNVANYTIPDTWDVTYPKNITPVNNKLPIAILNRVARAEFAQKEQTGNSIILDLNALLTSAGQVQTISIKIQVRAFTRLLKKINKLLYPPKLSLKCRIFGS